ncbi:hypothetical protein K435DRAFT_870467 [Dendrothele bispora CBS 962.96]|uniref:Uncharacterized protein n=1 Tax=Dendrothele bispora (strain CBS 962.96) TaxID=1314807 RepID=A0A4V4HCR8_DENBC|nr:hypothetical protein K435DRAFT_870467 [Dendrothele bispora CBS 962.96]
MVVPSTSYHPTPTQITPTSSIVTLSFRSTSTSIPPTSSTPSFSLTSAGLSPTSPTVILTDSSSIPPLPSSLGGISSILPSVTFSSTGKSQKNVNVLAIVVGSVGAAGFFVLILVFLLCRRKGERGVHTSNEGQWKTITPFRLSSRGIDQTLRTSAGLDNPLGGGERNDSEVAINGHGHGETDSPSVSVGTAGRDVVRIPAQCQNCWVDFRQDKGFFGKEAK